MFWHLHIILQLGDMKTNRFCFLEGIQTIFSGSDEALEVAL